jgi:hypothetical protein
MMTTWPSFPVGTTPFQVEFSSDTLVVYEADFARAGLSYTQVEGILRLNKDIPDVCWSFRSMSRHEISHQVQSLCGLYGLATMLSQCCAYSIAIDGGDDGNGTSLLDVQVHVFYCGRLQKQHATAMPMYKSPTGLHVHTVVDKVMVALDPNYRRKVIDVSTDDVSSMISHLRGIIADFRRLAFAILYHIWCLLYRMGLCLGAAIKSIDYYDCVIPGCNGIVHHKYSFMAVLKIALAALRQNSAVISNCYVIRNMR